MHETIPIPLFNLALIRFLNLNDSSLSEFRRRLQDHLSKNEGHLALLQFMQRNIDVDDMVSLEKRSNPRRNFMTEQCNSGYGDERKQGIEVLPDGFGSNFASSSSSGTGAAVDAFLHQTEKDFFSKKTCYLGKSTLLYSPEKLYSTYLGNKKADGINRFPKNWRSGTGNNRKDRALLGTKLAKKLGVECSRCFRDSCSGSKTG